MRDSKQLDSLLAAANQACEAAPWSTHNRHRTASVEMTAESGELIVCSVAQTRDRYSTIKAMTSFKVNGKVTSRASVLLLTNGARAEKINEEIRVAFELQAPALISAYANYLKDLLSEELKKRGPSLALTGIWDPGRNLIRNSLEPICDIAYEETGIGRNKIVAYILNESKLSKIATDYGYEASLDWFGKTNAKLGPLQNPVLTANAYGDIEVRGIRNGKLIALLQQRIFKTSVLGKPFLQFPARLYVDDKLTPEKQYHALFKPKESEQLNPSDFVDDGSTDHVDQESNSP